MEEKPLFYTIEQVAKMMQVSVETVRTWLRRKDKRLKSYRIGREFRIRVSDFDQWLQAQEYTEEEDEEEK